MRRLSLTLVLCLLVLGVANAQTAPAQDAASALSTANSLLDTGEPVGAFASFALVCERFPKTPESTEAMQKMVGIYMRASQEELDTCYSSIPSLNEMNSIDTMVVVGAFVNFKLQQAKRQAAMTGDAGDKEAVDALAKQLGDICWKAMNDFPNDERQLTIVETFLSVAAKQGPAEYEKSLGESLRLMEQLEGTTVAWAVGAVLAEGGDVAALPASPAQLLLLSKDMRRRAVVAEEAKETDKAAEYYGKAAKAAMRAMKGQPETAVAFEAAIDLYETIWRLSLAERQEYFSELRTLGDQQQGTIGSWAARWLLIFHLNGQRETMAQVEILCVWLRQEVLNGLFDTALSDKTVSGVVKIEMLYQIGYVMQHAGDSDAAMTYYTRIGEEYPDVPTAKERALYGWSLAWITDSTRDPAPAIEKLEKLVSTSPDSEFAPVALERLAEIASKRGNKAESAFYYSLVVDNYPETDSARCAMNQLAQVR